MKEKKGKEKETEKKRKYNKNMGIFRQQGIVCLFVCLFVFHLKQGNRPTTCSVRADKVLT